MNKVKVVRLVTTKGCAGCNIAKNLVRKAIEVCGIEDINLEIIDCLDEAYRQFINRYFIDDYPTIVFTEDNKVLTKFVGTKPVNDIVDDLKEWFH